MTKLKKQLAEAEKNAANSKKDKKAKEDSLCKKELDIEKTQGEIEKLQDDKRGLQHLIGAKKDMPEPLTFVKQRNDCTSEAKTNKDWLRKIEIAEFEAKKARAIIRRHRQK